jgi:hypothetical protein
MNPAGSVRAPEQAEANARFCAPNFCFRPFLRSSNRSLRSRANERPAVIDG